MTINGKGEVLLNNYLWLLLWLWHHLSYRNCSYLRTGSFQIWRKMLISQQPSVLCNYTINVKKETSVYLRVSLPVLCETTTRGEKCQCFHQCELVYLPNSLPAAGKLQDFEDDVKFSPKRTISIYKAASCRTLKILHEGGQNLVPSPLATPVHSSKDKWQIW